jgi:ubiquinone/menaquinone biosynthesis C-methylase UbiE
VLNDLREIVAIHLTSKEISEKYNHFARWYDVVEGIPDFLGVRKLRQRVLRQASGKVLEVAVGTGKNLPYYPHRCRIIAVDVSREMLKIARKRAAKLRLNTFFVLADVERLPFSDKSFDTVASSLTTCTFPEPVIALQEMARVCRTDGRVLLLEHGRSNRKWLGRWQDRRAESFAKQLCCHWNREPQELAKQAGLKIFDAQRFFFGIFHVIQAKGEG